MKHIKPINEFFGPFKKKSEDDKIAGEFLKRLSKVTYSNNPYNMRVVSAHEFNDMRYKDSESGSIILSNTTGVANNRNILFLVEFDDVFLYISKQQTGPVFSRHSSLFQDLARPTFKYTIYVKSPEEDVLDKVKCSDSISKKMITIVDCLLTGKLIKNVDGGNNARLDRIRGNINKAADLLESANRPTTADRLGLLQDLSVDLSDEGLYVEVTTDDSRFEVPSGLNIFLKIDDKDKVFCKNYPNDDMDWLVDKPIIKDFIKKLEGFGMVQERDYKVYGGGTSITLIFSGNGVKSIKL